MTTKRPGATVAGGLVLAILVAGTLGCSDRGTDAAPDFADPAQVEARVRATLEDLAAFGAKRAGSEEVARAADYIADRFRSAGLSDVHGEEFTFPAYDLVSTTLTVRVDGAPTSPLAEAFAFSGVGRAAGEVVDVGRGFPDDYVDEDVAGKIVLVLRDPLYHRSAQYLQAIEHGAAAMLYVSQAPDNLIQIGTVADPEDGAGPIPSISVGKDDGEALVAALGAGRRVEAEIAVEATVRSATGRNVVGRLPGALPGGPYLLVGAHYDTWYAGSADNGTGVAAVLEIAEAFAHRGGRQLDLVFVAYDAEELGLFGGYDWLRRHVIVGDEPMLGWVNFEIPAASPLPGLRGLAYTSGAPLDPALEDSGTSALYNAYVGMETVPALFGGVIPTDIQGMYWYGLQGFSTASDSPYYHTVEDTPDKIDTPFLADAVLHFEAALDLIDLVPPAALDVHDPSVWKIAPTTTTGASGVLDVDVLVTDASGAPQPDATVKLWLDVDDFTRVFRAQATSDASGRARFVIPAEALARGSGDRWVHVTAGRTHPLAETALPVGG
ncbi:MAG: M28 family peptidase [Deltaproteobacteria bacterium]|nr:M28 family peptidase [Deltaproteobacteria bacterium]